MSKTEGIFIGLGANLPAPGHASVRATLEAALASLANAGIPVVKRSSWWKSPAWPPVPPGEEPQPDYLNGVAAVESALGPDDLLARLHTVEASFGRVRQRRWESRPLDLDLLDYRGERQPEVGLGRALLPHPRMTARLFVLLPLQEIAPDWRDPVSGKGLDELVAAAESIKINRID